MAKFFSSSQVAKWRLLSQTESWEITKPWGDKFRKVLATLAPPFIPEDEVFIFDAPVWSGWGGADIRLTQVNHKDKSLTDGYFIATDFRFVFGDSKAKWASQIPYESIKAVYSDRDKGDFTLVLNDGSQVLIKTKFPRPTALAVFAVLGAPPAAKGNIVELEKAKAEIAKNFTGAILAFFTEIVDENRRRREGQSSPSQKEGAPASSKVTQPMSSLEEEILEQLNRLIG